MQILRDNLTEFNEGSSRYPPFSSLGGRLKQAEDSTYTAGEKMLTINWPVISRSVDKLHVVSPPKNRARSSQQRRTRNHNPKTEPSGRRLISPLFCSRVAIINDHYREQLVYAFLGRNYGLPSKYSWEITAREIGNNYLERADDVIHSPQPQLWPMFLFVRSRKRNLNDCCWQTSLSTRWT